MIYLNNDVKKILNLLNDNGYQAYVVGGAIRNILLGIDPLDYDITTNALPQQIIEVFKDYKTILTGIKYGTVTVVIDHKNYEITTYRIDGQYLNNRKPAEVKYANFLIEDLNRRDFTINALAFNNQLIDYNNGLNDLNNKIIRCIGNPDDRLTEDAIRILRAIKFSCKLDFIIENNTKKAIFKNKDLLKNISIERINKELFEIFKYINKNVLLEYLDVFLTIFSHMDYNIILNRVSKIQFLNEPILIYALFFEEKDFILLNKYKLSNYEKHIIKFVNTKLELKNDIIECKKILKNHQINDIILYINFNILNSFEKEQLISTFIQANELCHSLNQLNINGSDLLMIGFSNKEIGKKLDELLNLVIENKIVNKKEILLDYLKK